MDVSALDSSQWGLIFTLLSLDGIAPLYEAMGVRLPDKPRFQKLVRRLIVENRKIYEADPGAIPPLAARVLQEMEAAFGRPAAEHFYRWATTVFYFAPADQPQWTAWEFVLTDADVLRGEAILPPEKCDLLDGYLRASGTADLQPQVARLKAQPLSDWDLEMYSIHRFSNSDDVDDPAEEMNPFQFALGIVRMNRLQSGWEELFAQFSGGEKARLLNYGQRVVENERMWLPGAEEDEEGNIVAPGELQHPDAMRRQL